MLRAAVPPDEEARLAALYQLKILDTAPEERFDWITRVAQRLFGVPIAVIGLVDASRVWFKSRQGVAVAQIPRDVSICAHSILETRPLIVHDAQDDSRFRDFPMVNTEPHVRFYAACPLSGPDGSKVGVLSIADVQPRSVSDEEVQLLCDLARIVENELVMVPLNEALEQQRRAEEEIRGLNAALENAVEGISRLDPRGRYVSANRAYAEMLGWAPAELTGTGWRDMVHPEDVEAVTAAYQQMLVLGKAEVEARAVRKNGSLFYVHLVLVAARDRLDKFVGYYCFMKDVTERKEADEKMRRLATTDALTGLYNRHYFTERITEEMARSRRYGSQTCVLMIDLDRFKEVNDTYGHAMGDAVLTRVGKLIRGRLRAVDIAARYGGEEFCVLVAETSMDKAKALAEELRERVSLETFAAPRDERFHITCSIGVAELESGAREMAGILRLADAALYQAKAAGRNRVVIYEPRQAAP